MLQIVVEERFARGDRRGLCCGASGDEVAYAEVVGDHAGRLHFVHQEMPAWIRACRVLRPGICWDKIRFCISSGDHLYISRDMQGCASELIEVASRESCSVSAVHATRENLLPYYGTVGVQRLSGRRNPVSGGNGGRKTYPDPCRAAFDCAGAACRVLPVFFFGMHVLTPAVMDILGHLIAERNEQKRVGAFRRADHPCAPRAIPRPGNGALAV